MIQKIMFLIWYKRHLEEVDKTTSEEERVVMKPMRLSED